MSRRAWLLLAVVVVLWRIPYLFIKVAVAGVSAVFVVFVPHRGRGNRAAAASYSRTALDGLQERADLLVPLALVEITLPFLLISYGESYIASSLTGLLIATEPVFVAVFATRLPPPRRCAVGAARASRSASSA